VTELSAPPPAPFDPGASNPVPSQSVTPLPPERRSGRAEEPPALDDRIVEATKKGERWAWEAAYLAYAKALTGFLVVRLGDREDMAEALSETFLRALDRCHTFRGDSVAFRAWLFRIARNVATDRLRARSRAPRGDHDIDPIDLTVAGLDEGLISSEDQSAVRLAMAGLDADDREVLWLRICARLSSAEVGEIVGKKAGAVRMQQQRALQILARRLGTDMPDPGI
jgi:RNA polymerase sigma-70 factor, ECF subfamily